MIPAAAEEAKASNASIKGKLAIINRIFNLALESPQGRPRAPRQDTGGEQRPHGLFGSRAIRPVPGKAPRGAPIVPRGGASYRGGRANCCRSSGRRVDLEALEITLGSRRHAERSGTPDSDLRRNDPRLQTAKAIRDQNYPK